MSKQLKQQQISTETTKTPQLSPDINLKHDKLKSVSITTNNTTKTIPRNITPPSSINALPSWTFLQSKALTSDGTPVCCGVSGSNLKPGTDCITWQINSNDNSQLWQITKDGHLLSRLNGNYVMDFVNDGSQYQNNVIANNWNNYMSQIWKFNNESGQIENDNYENMYLGMKGSIDNPNFTPVNGTELIIATPSDNSNNLCFQWETSPSYPLNSILTQSPQSFPTFNNGNQSIAFQDISQQLAGVNDIRSVYTDVNSPFLLFTSQLQSMNYPNYISPEQFDEIRDQLYIEFGYAQAIVNLFINYNEFHTVIFGDNQSFKLNELILLCQLELGSTTSINGCILTLFNNILYNVLSNLPSVEGPIFSNLIQTAINIGVSSGNNITSDPFQVELSQLWDTLSLNFGELLVNIGNMEIMLLQDWGMMSEVNVLINTLSGPNSLAWSLPMTINMINAAIPAYENSILQMLIPAKFQIYRWDPNNNHGASLPSDIPSYCQWTDSNGIVYFIADIEDTSVYPTSQLMNLLWNSDNVSKEDFFLSNNGSGWNTPISLLNTGFGVVTPMFTNNTSTAMNFQIVFDTIQTFKYNLPTYSSTFSTDYDTKGGDDTNLEVTIWDNAENYIASLNIQVDQHFMRGATVTLVDSYIKPGYYIGSPICNQGSYSDKFTPTINIQIYENLNY